MDYKTINDAAEATGNLNYGKGQTHIWYWKKDKARDMLMGYDWLLKTTGVPSPKHLGDTHVLIGSIRARDLNEIYKIMQGENWSPNGEARGLIQARGTGHTSMSVGDIIQIGNHTWLVDLTGFQKIASEGQALLKEITLLATEKPELRKHLVPVIRKYALVKLTPKTIGPAVAKFERDMEAMFKKDIADWKKKNELDMVKQSEDDRASIRSFISYLKEGKYKTAYQVAGRFDTLVREYIPGPIWVFIGGEMLH